MRIYLVRHGMTEANEKHLYCGSTDLPLSERGAARLRQISCARPQVERFITSGLRRCDETMTILWGDVPRETVPAFREIDFGIFEMRGYVELRDDPAYQAWLSGDNEENVPPGGESGRQMQCRVLDAFDKMISDGRDAAIVTHGGTIAIIMAELFPSEGRSRYDWQPEPGCGYVLDIDGRQVIYRNWNEREGGAHMKKDVRNKKPEECAYSFVQHTACEFFPCHKTDHPEDFNCLFCYCPLYTLGSKCGGNFVYLDSGIKDCSNCLVPHGRGSYSYIISRYPELAELAKKNR